MAGSSRSILSTTEDGGASWSNHNLCAQSDGALAAAASTSVTVVCVGPSSGGTQAITVVASTDGGVTWREMCANAAWSEEPARASCPGGGYPSSLVATTDGTLIMGLARTGVLISTDGGAIWRRTLSIAGSPVDVESVGADAWAVSTSYSRLFASVNGGRSWLSSMLNIPSASPLTASRGPA